MEKSLFKVATAGNQKDIIDLVTNEPKRGEGTITSISYEEHFREQIAKKTRDHSYIVFKKVDHLANNFPCVKESTAEGKEIIVWCSNDYLL